MWLLQQSDGDVAQFNVPIHLALDDSDGSLFVVDVCNRRVALVSRRLDLVGDVAARHQFRWYPMRVCLDAGRRLLYVADNEMKDGDDARGRVVVISV